MSYRDQFDIEPPFLIFGRHPALWFRLCALFGALAGTAIGAMFVVNFLRNPPNTYPDFGLTDFDPRSPFVLFAEGLWFGFLLFLLSLVVVLAAWGLERLWHRLRR